MTIDQLAVLLKTYQDSGLGASSCLVGAVDCPLQDLEVVEEVSHATPFRPGVAFVFRSQEQC